MNELSISDLEQVSGGLTVQTVVIKADGPNGGTLKIINRPGADGELISTATWTPNKPA